MTLTIYVGPKKTGTSWLHHVVSGSTRAKEIRYPARWGRTYVYRNFVRDESLLIWPYLLHERGCLSALLDDLEAHDRTARIVVAEREETAWTSSMIKFLSKYGLGAEQARVRTGRELDVIAGNLAWLATRVPIEHVRIIDPTEADLRLMSDTCGVSVEELSAATGERVYETSESSRLPSQWLVEFFFRIKPFLPGDLRELTKARWLRAVFFRPTRKRSGENSRPS